MRIIKRMYSGDQKSVLLSSMFNKVIREIDIPLPFDYLEFKIGYPFSVVEENRASFGIAADDKMMEENDQRMAMVLIKFELYRLFVRNVITRKIPGIIEDVVVARAMIERGHSDDLVYLFYTYMMRNRVVDHVSFLKYNMPWIVFSGYDLFYHDLFYQLARSRRRLSYEHKAKHLIKALCKDLMDFENLKTAINEYEKYVYE